MAAPGGVGRRQAPDGKWATACRPGTGRGQTLHGRPVALYNSSLMMRPMVAMMRFLVVSWLAIFVRQCLGLPPAAVPIELPTPTDTPTPSPTATPFPGVVVLLTPSAGPVDPEAEIHLMRSLLPSAISGAGRCGARFGRSGRRRAAKCRIDR